MVHLPVLGEKHEDVLDLREWRSCPDLSQRIFAGAIVNHAFQLDLAAQIFAAIFVLFVRRVRQPAWRPLRGFLFSFMASSAFYPIIYACAVHGYSQMDVEAGATRYAVTVLVYLSAVTIYTVSSSEMVRPLFEVDR